MVLAHDAAIALRAAVVLANSELEPDNLTSLDELEQFCDAFGYAGRRDRDRAELDGIRAIRQPLRELLSADRDSAAPIVNRILFDAHAVLQLVRYEDWGWHLHATEPDRDLPDRILVETAMAMVDIIRSDEMSRLSRCANLDCSGLILDLSRNRSRRFCSIACGNRNAVAAYRARRRV